MTSNGTTTTTSTSSPGRSISSEDLNQLLRINEFSISPDGNQLVYTLRSRESKHVATNIYRIDLTKNPVAQHHPSSKLSIPLTHSKEKSNVQPTWGENCNEFFFLSNRSGTNQIWSMSLKGGEAYQVTSFPIDVETFKLLPRKEDMYVLFVASIYTDVLDFQQVVDKDEELKKNPEPYKFDQLMVRHWDQWEPYKKRNHLFVIKLQQCSLTSLWKTIGEPLDLMKGMESDCPIKPFNGKEDFDFTNEENPMIAFTCREPGDREMAWNTNFQIYTTILSEDDETHIISSSPPLLRTSKTLKVLNGNPCFSPRGQQLAYISMSVPGYEADCCKIQILDLKTNQVTSLTQKIDSSFHDLVWSKDETFIYALSSIRARGTFCRISVSNGKLEILPGGHHKHAFGLIDPHHSVVLESSLIAPADLYMVNHEHFIPMESFTSKDAYLNTNHDQYPVVLQSSYLERQKQFEMTTISLTEVNATLLDQLELPCPEEFYFQGSNDDPIHAWILPPVGFVQGKKYPLALIIHGGPQGYIGDDWHYRWNLQMYAARGFAVLAINFHGSTSFGQAFCDSIMEDWGGKPFQDLMIGVDTALQRYSFLDENKMVALGASYGGYMINWINGHTDRFKCLVCHAGVFDLKSMYYATEELYFLEREMQCFPWTDTKNNYTLQSPSTFVQQWKTPTLILHGEKDYRVLVTEGLAAFTALQRLKIPSKLVVFPNENHWILNPRNNVLWHEEIFQWIETYTS